MKGFMFLLLSFVLFNSCNDSPTPNQREKVKIILPSNQVDSLKITESYRYKGIVRNGPGYEINIADKESYQNQFEEGNSSYTGWLNGELINNSNAFVLSGNPNKKGIYYFIINVKREDNHRTDKSIVTKGLTIKVK